MDWQEIEKERRAAEHLLYVSLKYTKTCDIINNLIVRWRNMVEKSIDALLEKQKKKKAVKAIPIAPKLRVDMVMEQFKKEKTVLDAVRLFIFFKKLQRLEYTRECEFRKNVALVILEEDKAVRIDLDKLKEYENILERFISFVKNYIQ